MSDWSVQDAIEAAKKDPEAYGRQAYELSNKRIELSNKLRALEGWHFVDDKAKRSGDVMLHLDTGHNSDGVRSWLTVIGSWDGRKWVGSGLSDMRPSYWSPIPETPEHLRVLS